MTPDPPLHQYYTPEEVDDILRQTIDETEKTERARQLAPSPCGVKGHVEANRISAGMHEADEYHPKPYEVFTCGACLSTSAAVAAALGKAEECVPCSTCEDGCELRQDDNGVWFHGFLGDDRSGSGDWQYVCPKAQVRNLQHDSGALDAVIQDQLYKARLLWSGAIRQLLPAMRPINNDDSGVVWVTREGEKALREREEEAVLFGVEYGMDSVDDESVKRARAKALEAWRKKNG